MIGNVIGYGDYHGGHISLVAPATSVVTGVVRVGVRLLLRLCLPALEACRCAGSMDPPVFARTLAGSPTCLRAIWLRNLKEPLCGSLEIDNLKEPLRGGLS